MNNPLTWKYIAEMYILVNKVSILVGLAKLLVVDPAKLPVVGSAELL